jgi:hypothetical protein
MAISTADELRTAIANWTKADDLETDRLNEFIAIAEARFNRDLRVRAMLNTMSSTALTDGSASLPSGFLAFEELRYDGDFSHTLQPKSLEWIRAQESNTNEPRFFAIDGSQVICWPTSGNIEGTYYKALDSLASNSSNWLLTSHPDLYLFACLEEAAIFENDMQRGSLWGNRAAALLDQIQRDDVDNSFMGGVLAIRAR